MLNVSELIKHKGLASNVAVLVMLGYIIFQVTITSVRVTARVAEEVRKIERGLDSRFAEMEDTVVENRREMERKLIEAQSENEERFAKMQAQIDQAWTVYMMDMRDTMVATKNTNNWIPDARRIFDAVRSGRTPDSIQIRP